MFRFNVPGDFSVWRLLRSSPAALSVLSLVAFLMLQSCNSSGVITRPQDVIFPDSNVSYLRHVDPLLRLGCAFNGCHNTGSMVPLDSYISLFQTPGLLVPNKPESSTLYQVISGQLSHTYSLNQIVTENHKKGIATWIREGSKNN